VNDDDLETLTSRLLVALYVIVFTALIALVLLANHDPPAKPRPARSPFVKAHR